MVKIQVFQRYLKAKRNVPMGVSLQQNEAKLQLNVQRQFKDLKIIFPV